MKSKLIKFSTALVLSFSLLSNSFGSGMGGPSYGYVVSCFWEHQPWPMPIFLNRYAEDRDARYELEGYCESLGGTSHTRKIKEISNHD